MLLLWNDKAPLNYFLSLLHHTAVIDQMWWVCLECWAIFSCGVLHSPSNCVGVVHLGCQEMLGGEKKARLVAKKLKQAQLLEKHILTSRCGGQSDKLLHSRPEISLKLGTIQGEFVDYDSLPFVSSLGLFYVASFDILCGMQSAAKYQEYRFVCLFVWKRAWESQSGWVI